MTSLLFPPTSALLPTSLSITLPLTYFTPDYWPAVLKFGNHKQTICSAWQETASWLTSTLPSGFTQMSPSQATLYKATLSIPLLFSSLIFSMSLSYLTYNI